MSSKLDELLLGEGLLEKERLGLRENPGLPGGGGVRLDLDK
ncbi:hypothetical protein FACS1894122_10520 [Alphaproteobacteria bacterium]|nr:hypothetical protein FACS1894122_10520 [Alphaproteobacteria bacterium]